MVFTFILIALRNIDQIENSILQNASIMRSFRKQRIVWRRPRNCLSLVIASTKLFEYCKHAIVRTAAITYCPDSFAQWNLTNSYEQYET